MAALLIGPASADSCAPRPELAVGGLLERDAQWLFEWGQTWTVDSTATRLLTSGTPVLIVGHYDFDAAPRFDSCPDVSADRQAPWFDVKDELVPAPRPQTLTYASEHTPRPLVY